MTRLVWVILFAVVVGLVLLFLVRAFQSGSAANQRLAELEATRALLSKRFPDREFSLRLSASGSGARNLVILVRPGLAPAVDATFDSILAVAAEKLRDSGYDSILVRIQDRVVRRQRLK